MQPYEPRSDTPTPAYPISPPAQQYPPQYVPPPPGYPQMYGPPPKPPQQPVEWKKFGIILGAVLGGIGLLFAIGYVVPSGSSDLDVNITSCEFTDGPLPSGTVGYVVTNNGDSRDTATISVEYQNFRGEKVDDDVETSQDVAPGQTLRGEIHTLLDVAVGNGGKCIITGIS